MTVNKKTKAILGKAVINGEVAHAAKIQAQRMLDIFNPKSSNILVLRGECRKIEVPEFTAEVYLFLLAANQLTSLLENNRSPKKQLLTDKELSDIRQLRNIWEHRYPATTRLFTKWKSGTKEQEDWLEATFAGNRDQVYVIEADDYDTKIAGIVSVNRVLKEANYWIEVSKDFNDPKFLWFPSDDQKEDSVDIN